MNARSRWCLAGLAAGLAASSLPEAAAAVLPEPDVREFWVPQKNLAEVLKASPKAVLLTADQYAALLRDSRPRKPEQTAPPPAAAILRSAHYQGTPGDGFVTLRAEFSVECLTGEWTEVPLELHPRWLGSVTMDGGDALQPAGDPNPEGAKTVLVLRGAGRHALKVDFAVPVAEEAGRRSLTLTAPGAAEATLTLSIPDKVKLESSEPFTQHGGEAVFALPPRGPFRISWSKQDLAPLDSAAVFQECTIRYNLNPVRLEADLQLGWQALLRPLPRQLVLPLPPNTTVLGVDGPEIHQWTLAGDRLVVDFLPGDRKEASLRLALERGLALAAGGGPAKLQLPAPVAEGVQRASGRFSLTTTRDLRLRQVSAGPLSARDDSGHAATDGSGTWVFPVLPAPPEVEVEVLSVQFAATLDTQISLTREAVRLTRWLTLTPRDGTLFSPRLEGLMPGEEIESVRCPDSSEPGWRQTGNGIAFSDNKGIAAGTPWTVVVSSRLDPAGWQTMAGPPLALSFGSARVPGAEKVNGYVALDFDDALLVATQGTTGLESRDPRQFAGVLPLTGRLAWSRLEDYQLNLGVSRRAPEYDAAVLLYALPLLNSLEVEGALTLTVDRSPLREVLVAFPAESAAAVRWDSPLLAESSLEPDHSWRLRFHQETMGTATLRFRLSLPLADLTGPAPGGSPPPGRRFTVAAPVPAVPGARRLRGTVVVEANTDTELSFTATGLNALDTLRAPALEGYLPGHRLVAAWTWPGGTPSLTVSGMRHRPAGLISTVVDRLALDTVISRDGRVRHQARMEVRTAGDQYLDVVLPDQARVLTLLVNDGAVKPVRNRQGGLRVPLSGSPAVIRLICESHGEPMPAAASGKLVPVTLDPALPVLDTQWQLHLPDGFSYRGFESNLTAADNAQATPGVVALAWTELNPFAGKIMAGKASGPAPASDRRETDTGYAAAPAANPEEKSEITANDRLPREPNRRFSKSNLFSDAKDRTQTIQEEPAQVAAPPAPVLQTRTFQVPTDYLSKGSAAAGSGLSSRPDAKSVLAQLGVEFGEGAAATFATASGTLVVRNTPEQIAAVESVLAPLTAAARDSSTIKGDKAGADDREGILPLDFALPEGGRVYRFSGQYAPGTMEFRYESWERQLQWSWLWMFVGAGAFRLLARRSPWFIGLSGLLLLQFIPGVLAHPEWLPAANALVIGWVAAGGLRLISWTLRKKPMARAEALPAGPAVVLLALLLTQGATKLLAQEVVAPPGPPANEVPTVVVPYDPDQPAGGAAPDRRYLDYGTFQRLWTAAKLNRAEDAARAAAAPAPGARGATLTSALHRAVVDGALLRVEAVFALQTRGPDWVGVPFPLTNGLRSLTLDGAPAALKEGQLLVEKAGPHTLSAAYDIPLPAGWQEVSWPVPAATATSLALSLAMDDPARPVVNADSPLVESQAGGRRVFTAILGTTSNISLKRRVTAQRAGAQAADPPLAEVHTRIFITPALERVEASVAFTFTGQTRGDFTLRLDPGLTPVSFQVPGLEHWTLRHEADAQVLDLRLERPASGRFSVGFVAERPAGALPLTESAPLVSAAAARVDQVWSVLATDDLEVRMQETAGHQRVESAKAPGTEDEGFDAVGTWQSSGHADPLRWELRARVPEASAIVRYALQPGSGKLEMSAGMELHPAPGQELRELKIRLPAGVTLQGVTGERLADWWQEDDALQVRFAGGGAAVTRLALHLTRPLPADAAEVTFTPLLIEGFARVEGSGLLIAPVNQEAVLRLAPAAPSLREVAPQDTRSGFTVRFPFEEKRGFVFQGTGWTATASLKPQVARYDVDWVMDAEVRDSWVELNTRVLLGLTRGGTDRIGFTTPAAAPELRLTGDDVRETVSVVEGDVRRYTVSFQTLMTGAVLFTLTGQMPHSGSAALPALDFPGAARTARFVIVNNKSEGELKVETAGLDPTPREQVSFLPAELASGRSGAQFYRAQPAWSLKLEVAKLETTAGQAAVVLHADLTTSLLRNGDLWQRAVYVVQNRALQFLPVHLPDGVEVISVAVGGESTRADQGLVDGLPVLLVPLIQTVPGELATEVQLIFRRRGQPGVFPSLLDDPDLPGLPVGQTFWTVQFPDGYSLKSGSGNMTTTDDSGLSSGRALSRLSEVASLGRIAQSERYDSGTRARAIQNARNIASAYGTLLQDEAGREIRKVVEQLQLEEPQKTAGPPVAPEQERGLEQKAKQFFFNGTTQQQVEALNQTREAAKPADLTLNDNVAWSFSGGGRPSARIDAAIPQARSRRLSQIDRLDQSGPGGQPAGMPGATKAESSRRSAAGKEITTGSLTAQPGAATPQAEFPEQNNEYSFQNARLNKLPAAGQSKGLTPPAAPDQAPQPAALPPAPGPAAEAKPDNSQRPGLTTPDGASGKPSAALPRLRATGRQSLEAVFPEQKNAAHFKKVKGDAALQVIISVPLRKRIHPESASALGAGLAALLLLRWVYCYHRRSRPAVSQVSGAP